MERRAAIQETIEAHPDWNAPAIARACNVSEPTVHNQMKIGPSIQTDGYMNNFRRVEAVVMREFLLVPAKQRRDFSSKLYAMVKELMTRA
jgi:hypothetical protein